MEVAFLPINNESMIIVISCVYNFMYLLQLTNFVK